MLGGHLVELDRIDDELFSTDYRAPTQQRHTSLLPEPATLRLRRSPASEPPTVRLPSGVPSGSGPLTSYRPVPGAVWAAGTRSTGGWPTVAYPRHPAELERTGSVIIAVVGTVVLVVLTVGVTCVVAWIWP